MNYKDVGASPEERASDLLSRMTLEEKLAQLGSCWAYQLIRNGKYDETGAAEIMKYGIGQVTRVGGSTGFGPEMRTKLANRIQRFLMQHTRLGIPAIIHEEACSGLMVKGATCFPQTIGISCSFEPEIAEEMGRIISKQARATGAQQVLAPLLDICRDPRWGRMEETFGEDPYLVSSMGVSFIRGLQGGDMKQGVIATGKHFVGYGNSEGGMNWAPAHIPPRELREVFLAPFEAAVREANLYSVMNGYHELDGVPCAASRELLHDILREQWGFDGIVVSDYFAVNMLYEYHAIAKDKQQAAKMALYAGLDVELPNTDCMGGPAKEAAESGALDIAYIDRAVCRVLLAKFRLGLFEKPYVDEHAASGMMDTPAQRQAAYTAAQKSIVLLKNERHTLPLNGAVKSIAVIGPSADDVRYLLGDYAYPCHIENLVEIYEGNNALGQPLPDQMELEDIYPPISSILAEIRKAAPAGADIQYARGCGISDSDESGFEAAVSAAGKADVAIVFAGDKSGLVPSCTVGESRDMCDLHLPGVQEKLIEAISRTGTPLILVLINGRSYSLCNVQGYASAIVEAWLPGEEGGKAIADVLFGTYNPGGKLSMSVPRSSGQIPVYYYHKKSGGRSHWRGDYVDMSSSPLYPFGFGLSYTEFAYSGLKISRENVSINETVDISVTIKNTGGVKGDEVVQLYINDMEAKVTRPVKELKGFKRVTLMPGERRDIVFTLSANQLGYYDMDMNYIVDPGRINVMIGSSSEDLRLCGSFEIVGNDAKKADKAFFSHVSVI